VDSSGPNEMEDDLKNNKKWKVQTKNGRQPQIKYGRQPKKKYLKKMKENLKKI
jgi:hypothetical protein